MQKVTDEANKRSSVLERDNQRSDVQLADMGQQVRPKQTILSYNLANLTIVIELGVENQSKSTILIIK